MMEIWKRRWILFLIRVELMTVNNGWRFNVNVSNPNADRDLGIVLTCEANDWLVSNNVRDWVVRTDTTDGVKLIVQGNNPYLPATPPERLTVDMCAYLETKYNISTKRSEHTIEVAVLPYVPETLKEFERASEGKTSAQPGSFESRIYDFGKMTMIRHGWIAGFQTGNTSTYLMKRRDQFDNGSVFYSEYEVCPSFQWNASTFIRNQILDKTAEPGNIYGACIPDLCAEDLMNNLRISKELN
jgi:hypothetical protein